MTFCSDKECEEIGDVVIDFTRQYAAYAQEEKKWKRYSTYLKKYHRRRRISQTHKVAIMADISLEQATEKHARSKVCYEC